jgi:uncharacterized membrane protein (DUF106 family)
LGKEESIMVVVLIIGIVLGVIAALWVVEVVVDMRKIDKEYAVFKAKESPTMRKDDETGIPK